MPLFLLIFVIFGFSFLIRLILYSKHFSAHNENLSQRLDQAQTKAVLDSSINTLIIARCW